MTEPTAPSRPTDPAAGWTPDSALGARYVLERELGHGAAAVVYLAREVKHERQVAIKVLRPEVSVAFGAERFLREIGIAARLSHPHLVPLIDSGEADGVLYYVSAYVQGGSLRDRLTRDRRIEWGEVVRVLDEVGAGLDFAHRAGFVHRDVKPENILFADGHALLADFGIARAMTSERTDTQTRPARGSARSGVTEPGLAVGTPAYMSPEQAAGDSTVDARSDVYALACVAFEMLTGEPPFVAKSSRQVLAKHVTETPRRVRELAPEVPSSVDDAIHRALSKDPAHRWPTVAQFVAAFHSTDASARARLGASTARGIAVLPFVNASPDPANEYLSDGLTDELINALATVEGIRVASRTSAFALKGKPQDVRVIGALLDCAYVLEGTVRGAGQQLRITAQLTSTEDGRAIWSHRYDRRLDDVLAIQDEIAQTIVNTLRAGKLGELLPAVAQRHTRNAAAYGLYLKGQYEMNRRTQEGVANAIRYFEQAISEDPGYALAYAGLADSYALQLDYRSVSVHEGLDRALQYARQAISLDDTLAEPHASLGWRHFIYDWDWPAAEREIRRALELNPRYAWAHQVYGFLYSARGQSGDAVAEGHTATELDAGSVSARRALAWHYYYARRWDQSVYHAERALTMNPNAEETYRVLGHVLAIQGAFDDAERVLREAVAMPESGTYTRATLAYALARAGRVSDAQGIREDLREQARTGYVSPVAFATISIGLGEIDEAVRWAKAAYDERRGWLAYIKVNPLMDPLRGHPGFESLVAAMRL